MPPSVLSATTVVPEALSSPLLEPAAVALIDALALPVAVGSSRRSDPHPIMSASMLAPEIVRPIAPHGITERRTFVLGDEGSRTCSHAREPGRGSGNHRAFVR
jgi:hypothetical protein